MTTRRNDTFLRNYGFSLVLLGAIALGSLAGIILGPKAALVKPLGDIFLNLLFTAVVPLVFFSLASAVARVTESERLRRIVGYMMLVFVLTGMIAALLMVAGVKLYPPAGHASVPLPSPIENTDIKLADQLVRSLTVSDFKDLFSRNNMLALIIVSIVVGLAAARTGEKGARFVEFLAAGDAVMGKVMSYIMLYAPVGLAAYFAFLVGTFGSQIAGAYVRAVTLYYPLAIFYFFAAFSLYAFAAGRREGLKRFWGNIVPAAVTAWGTGSSVATIPANLEASRRIGVPKDIRELIIPVGATIHMEGSCLSAILKIAFIFSIFGRDFAGADVIAGAVCIAILSGTVMGGIPGGGFLGEMLIVSMYGLPPEALPLLAMIGTLVDPPATMVNSCGDTIASMLVARILGGRSWMEEQSSG